MDARTNERRRHAAREAAYRYRKEREECDAVAEHLAHGLAIADHRIPDDLAIPAFLRRRKLDAGEEYRLAWAGIEGFTEGRV